MYIYPDNLKSKAVLWLWELRDIAIVGVGALISVFAMAQLGLLPPVVVTGLCISLHSAGRYQHFGLPALCDSIFSPGPADLCLGTVRLNKEQE